MVRKNCVRKKVMVVNEALPRARSPLRCKLLCTQLGSSSSIERMVLVLPLGHCDLAVQHATLALSSRDRGRSGGQPEKETTGESKVQLPKMILVGMDKSRRRLVGQASLIDLAARL